MRNQSIESQKRFTKVHRALTQRRALSVSALVVGLLAGAGAITAAGANPEPSSQANGATYTVCYTYDDIISWTKADLNPNDHPGPHKFRTLGENGTYVEDGPTPGPIFLARTAEYIAHLKVLKAAAISRGDSCIGDLHQLPVDSH